MDVFPRWKQWTQQNNNYLISVNKIVNKFIEKLKKVPYIIKNPPNKTKDTVSDKIKEKLTDATDSTNQSLSPSLLRESSTITSTSKKKGN